LQPSHAGRIARRRGPELTAGNNPTTIESLY
jgi:hypothetical protein